MVVLGCDVGGTFTDCVLLDAASGRVASCKVPTTPKDPSEGAARGLLLLLEREGVPPARVQRVVHGTTVGTNAVLTGRGPRVALVTNENFEDVLEIGRQNRPDLYDPLVQRPAPLVPRGSRLGVHGRLGPDGAEIEPVDAAGVRALGPTLQDHDAVAVVLLHAYANPTHEEAVARLIRDVAPDARVATSSGTAPEFREFERASTTVVNAFLLPIMDRYLDRLRGALDAAGVRAPLLVFDSAGGVLTPEGARARPVRTVLSGPAGGASAGARVAELAGEPNLLGLDMGGTSTDLSLTVGGVPQEAPEGEIGGHPLRIPMLDVSTLGAGGGSLARVDAAGLLRVGPASAGAEPGPACYGRGGESPTVTDAHAVLGHVASLLDGAFPLDVGAARRSLEPVADALGLDVEEAAEAVLRLADADILTAARVAVTRRGHDPRDFALCAFGGAGPLHAVEVARGLGLSRGVVPPTSGVLSAYGLLTAPLRRDGVRAWLRGELDGLPAALEELGEETRAAAAAEGVPVEGADVRFAADARYVGQSFELAVPFESPKEAVEVRARFEEAHRRAFGYADADARVEVVNLRATVLAPLHDAALPRLPTGGAEPPANARRGTRSMRFDGAPVEGVVWARSRLLAGNRVEGPAVVEDAGSTTLLPPGSAASVDAWGNLLLEVGA